MAFEGIFKTALEVALSAWLKLFCSSSMLFFSLSWIVHIPSPNGRSIIFYITVGSQMRKLLDQYKAHSATHALNEFSTLSLVTHTLFCPVPPLSLTSNSTTFSTSKPSSLNPSPESQHRSR